MIETVFAVGLIMFIFGYAGVSWYDNYYTIENKISSYVFYLGIALIIIGTIGLLI